MSRDLLLLDDLEGTQSSLLDLVDHLLGQGCVLRGELMLGLAGVDLVYVELSAVLCAADHVAKLKEQEDGAG